MPTYPTSEVITAANGSAPNPVQEQTRQPKFISWENSNSWLKRHDAEGTLIIQAGYRLNPSLNAAYDEENPIVTFDNEKRWYGHRPCAGDHTRSYELNKIETARDHFAATLRPSDNDRELRVMAAHWNSAEFSNLQEELMGEYQVVKNGHTINTTVVEVIPVLEGIGSYHLLRPHLKKGSTLLIEIGFGTAELWILDESGQVVDGAPVTKLGILQLAKKIADDPMVKATLSSSGASSINLSLLSRALQERTLQNIPEAQWTEIKYRYITNFCREFQGFVTAQYESQKQDLVNVILTGGGAALMKSIQPRISEMFLIPPDPQTASVRGSYLHQAA